MVLYDWNTLRLHPSLIDSCLQQKAITEKAKNAGERLHSKVREESVSHKRLWNFSDVTLADEDAKSKLTDNAKRAIQGNEAMQVMPSGGQICY